MSKMVAYVNIRPFSIKNLSLSQENGHLHPKFAP